MIQINLLPWREQARKIALLQFGVLLGFSTAATVLLIISIHIYYAMLIHHQETRNHYIQAEINKREPEFRRLTTEKRELEALKADFKLVGQLRMHSFQAVALMDALVRATPKTITLTKLIRIKDTIELEGDAQSDLDVTYFMKNLTGVLILKNPILTELSASQATDSSQGRHFKLQVDLKEM